MGKEGAGASLAVIGRKLFFTSRRKLVMAAYPKCFFSALFLT
jgi:hypothetical protein